MSMSKMPLSLVLSGGGVRALAHVGAITRLEQLGILSQITHFAGASAGAGLATLLAAGYTCEELFRFMMELDYRGLIGHNPIKEGYDLVKRYGIHDNRKLQDAFEKGLASKVGASTTFAELLARTGKTLIMPATNLTMARTDVFSPETTPDIPIKDALSLTTDIPLFFTAQSYAAADHEALCTYTDGGLLNNLPTDLVPQPSIAINLTAPPPAPQSTANLSDYLYTLLETMSNEIDGLKPKYGEVLSVNTGPIAATDFDLTFPKKVGLIKKGYDAAKQWKPPTSMMFDSLDKIMATVTEHTAFPSYWATFATEKIAAARAPAKVDDGKPRCSLM
jgi:predicted acylesterase/phospholipase RssA